MIAALKRLLKKDETPEVVKLYRKAKTEREALLLLKEARNRDEGRRREANTRLSGITGEEQVLMSEGKQEDTTEGRRHFLVRRIKELREEQRSLEHKVDKIYNPRLKAINQHIQSLETVIEVTSEPIPTIESMETTAVRARTMMANLDDAVELAHGISKPFIQEGPDKEEEGILQEMADLREKDREKARKEKEKEKKGKEKEAKRSRSNEITIEEELGDLEEA